MVVVGVVVVFAIVVDPYPAPTPTIVERQTAEPVGDGRPWASAAVFYAAHGKLEGEIVRGAQDGELALEKLAVLPLRGRHWGGGRRHDAWGVCAGR